MTPLTPSELALAYELRQGPNPCSWNAISVGLGKPAGVIRSAVHHVVKVGIRNGLGGHVRRQGRTPVFSAATLKAANRMRLQGYTWPKIAGELTGESSERAANRIRRACERSKNYLYEESTMIKDPPFDKVLSADFADLEKRVAEHLGGRIPKVQTKLLDLHTVTAALTNKVMYSEVTPDQRRAAKSRNFMALYTPGTKWQPPSEPVFRAIYTDQEWMQMCMDFRLARPTQLYERIQLYFQGYGK